MRRWLRVAAGVTLAALAGGPAPARPPEELEFTRFDVDVGGKVTEVVVHDLDGDGRQDLLVVRGREALVFFQPPDGAWRRQPNQRFRFHPRAVLFDVGDLDGDGAAEVVLLDGGGLSAYRQRTIGGAGRRLFGLRPIPLAQCPTFLSQPIRDEVRRKELLRDLDGDGDLDAVLPLADGFALLANDGQGALAAPVELAAPPNAAVVLGRDRLTSQLFASYWFPNPNVAQWDAEGAPELVLAREGRLSIYRAAAPGALPTTPAGGVTIPGQRLPTRDAEDMFALDFTMPLVIRDIDGDGRADVSSTHVGEGTTRIYRNGAAPAAALAEPALTLRAKGITLFAYYADIDGDGRLDLILPRMDEVSIWTILKALIARSVPVEVLIFRQRPDGGFPPEPDAVSELDVPLQLRSTERGLRVGSSVVASVEGDYDADGRRDALVRSDDGALGVLRGDGVGFSDDVSGEVELPELEEHQFVQPIVADLDGDGRSDVVVRLWSWDRDDDRVVLLRSRGRP